MKKIFKNSFYDMPKLCSKSIELFLVKGINISIHILRITSKVNQFNRDVMMILCVKLITKKKQILIT